MLIVWSVESGRFKTEDPLGGDRGVDSGPRCLVELASGRCT